MGDEFPEVHTFESDTETDTCVAQVATDLVNLLGTFFGSGRDRYENATYLWRLPLRPEGNLLVLLRVRLGKDDTVSAVVELQGLEQVFDINGGDRT